MNTDEQKQLVTAFVQTAQKVARSRIAIELQEMGSNAIDLQHAGLITDEQRRALVEATLATMDKLQEMSVALMQIVHAIGGDEEWPTELMCGEKEEG